MTKLFVVIAALVIPVSAQAATKHRPQARTYAPQQQIACTYAGCLPVPRGCHPAAGRTWSGLESGFDVIVCPDGTRYGQP
jgi:hypothetical protein